MKVAFRVLVKKDTRYLNNVYIDHLLKLDYFGHAELDKIHC